MKADEFLEKEQLADNVQNEIRIAQSSDRKGEIKSLRGDWNGALKDCQKSLKMKLKCLGENDLPKRTNRRKIGSSILDQNYPHFASSCRMKGLVLSIQDQFDLGLSNSVPSMFEKLPKIQTSVFDLNHPNVTDSFCDVGVVYVRNQNKSKEVHSMFQMSLEIRKPILDHNYPNVAKLYNYIGRAYFFKISTKRLFYA
ncbi:hypothetical protein TrispH2_011114 [Trichoplax sp. H2]|nr:hypothetical protein TrispH2_011114 [Trichoplax sp. H2]|eukprot:RDD36936.1 hypothetical protein TrispH2_011114 [Trichoplax sp. H2]